MRLRILANAGQILAVDLNELVLNEAIVRSIFVLQTLNVIKDLS